MLHKGTMLRDEEMFADGLFHFQVFGIIQMIVSCVAISFGFGKSTVLLSADQVVNAEKVSIQYLSRCSHMSRS
jgi:hypothetical protein